MHIAKPQHNRIKQTHSDSNFIRPGSSPTSISQTNPHIPHKLDSHLYISNDYATPPPQWHIRTPKNYEEHNGPDEHTNKPYFNVRFQTYHWLNLCEYRFGTTMDYSSTYRNSFISYKDLTLISFWYQKLTSLPEATSRYQIISSTTPCTRMKRHMEARQ